MFTFTLTVILILGGGKDDITQSRDMPSLLKCFDAAAAWTTQDTRSAGDGVIGFAAGCAVNPIPGRDG
jgi:hypothetical protein